jgi:hypothetical protein
MTDLPMQDQTLLREATVEERAAIESLLVRLPSAATRWKHGAENAFVLLAASLLSVVVIWLVIGWALGKALSIDLGLYSSASRWVIGLAVPICALYAVTSSVLWTRSLTDHRPLLRDDLASSKVIEERYEFAEAKRFQEPEHGGLIYFLRSASDNVLAVYDHESQTLGLDGQDPLTSRFKPLSMLTLVRAPKSGYVLSSQSSGRPLHVGSPEDLLVDPRDWPEQHERCDIPWDQLEVRLGNATR